MDKEVPFCVHRINGTCSASILTAIMVAYGQHTGSYALLGPSSYGEENPSRQLVGLFPNTETWIEDGVCRQRTGASATTLHGNDPWLLLQKATATETSHNALAPPWGGFIAYEMARDAGQGLTAYFTRCYVTFFCEGKEAHLILLDGWEQAVSKLCRLFIARLLQGEEIKNIPLPEIATFTTTHDLKITLEKAESYCHKVNAIRELIRDGWVYQVNLSHQITIEGEINL